MAFEVKLNQAGGPISAGVRILVPHIGISALDLWLDVDNNGKPDTYSGRIKSFNHKEGEYFAVGSAAMLFGNVLQWVWLAAKSPDAKDTDEVQAELLLQQDGKNLATTGKEPFPLTQKNAIRAGRRYDIFETWVRFV